ncbi:periplasmic binding protein [Oceanithermus profundus DSM 14977]|uniref:Periplasmic binding protein n=1 Tax=Oceanithermus profundus (strain DSM 14977 / NBRC 100410 / VKM B-2274 / 506) TaxID=670487 RepID=E4U7U3_OCEP5|nr:helical backbone metal receptor [Oceanithermus profundus]ADR36542.1 periplasmic binding protein [Oceanithermus profundus DSM 14977]
MKVRHDALGVLELPDDPRRIVSLAPNVTEALFALGAGERLVGRSAFCWRPDAAARLPVVSSYTKIRWELLHELRPDLVFTTTAVQGETTRALHERGYPVWPLPLPNSPWGILENLATLGAFLGLAEAAAELAGALAARYGALAGRLRGLRVYLEYDLGGPITIGRAAFMSAALAHLGAVNVFGDRPEAYFEPEIGAVLERAPDLLVFEPKRIQNREAQLRAVEQKLEARGWRGRPWVATRGDELAHFGPGFFGYLETWAEAMVKAVEEPA